MVRERKKRELPVKILREFFDYDPATGEIRYKTNRARRWLTAYSPCAKDRRLLPAHCRRAALQSSAFSTLDKESFSLMSLVGQRSINTWLLIE